MPISEYEQGQTFGAAFRDREERPRRPGAALTGVLDRLRVTAGAWIASPTLT